MSKRAKTAMERIDAFKSMSFLKTLPNFFAPDPNAGMLIPPARMVVRAKKDGSMERTEYKRVTVGIASVEREFRAWKRTRTVR